jgi:hypothetical protein
MMVVNKDCKGYYHNTMVFG